MRIDRTFGQRFARFILWLFYTIRHSDIQHSTFHRKYFSMMMVFKTAHIIAQMKCTILLLNFIKSFRFNFIFIFFTTNFFFFFFLTMLDTRWCVIGLCAVCCVLCMTNQTKRSRRRKKKKSKIIIIHIEIMLFRPSSFFFFFFLSSKFVPLKCHINIWSDNGVHDSYNRTATWVCSTDVCAYATSCTQTQ